MSVHPELAAHVEYYEKQILEIAPCVYQAFGFAASNVYMLVGDDGLIIIDTTESTKAAENILAEFRKITDLPVKTIIFTHSHRDHVSGASVFAEGGSPEIFASHNFSSDILGVASAHPGPDEAMKMRTRRQFGITLSYPDEVASLGVGPGDHPLVGMGAGQLPPTKRIGEVGETITRHGITLKLAMAPGETPDHMIVWLEDRKVLFSGDNFYRSFPNLYAIRGTVYRDFDAWADTMDLLMAYNAEVLAPGHTRCLTGSETIREVLIDYRDAIRHVVNSTRDGMDAGLTIDELAHSVKLPPDLASKPYLKEYYGRVDWSVRAYCAGTLGWFDGNPTSLGSLSPKDEAEQIIKLAGGVDAVLAAVNLAQNECAFQWALQLVDRLIAADDHAEEARKIKQDLLRKYADEQINACTRNYYLSWAQESASADANK